MFVNRTVSNVIVHNRGGSCGGFLVVIIYTHPHTHIISSSVSLLTEPDWASYTLGIFVCLNCSGIHRNLPDISKVKSIRLDIWDDALVEVSSCSLYSFYIIADKKV